MIAVEDQMLRPPDQLARGDFEMVVRKLADDLAFGMDVSRFIGSGLEYAKSRPYSPGDTMKMFDWKITARTGKPFVKQYETLKRTTFYLVLDTSASMSVSSTAVSKHDVAVWVASAVGLIAQRHMSPVAVVGAGERETRVDPSLRRSDLWRSIEPLRAHQLAESTRLSERLIDLDIRASRASVVLVLSDLHDPNSTAALRRAAQRHDVIAIHLTDPAELGRLGAGFFRGQEAETGTSFLATGRTKWPAQGELASELARSGVSYLRLQTDRSFIGPLRHFLATRPSVSGGRG
ncbi:MAG: DUF58 domain-containing protein [Phycisphaerales bacterium]